MNTVYGRRLFLRGAAAGSLMSLAPFLVAQTDERIVKVIAQRFSYTPTEISLSIGVPAVLELSSFDIVMGFSMPDFGVRTDVFPGRISRVRFMPDKTGRFVFHCDIFCGSGHEDMAGVIVVS